ncbi:hypothetical protein A235_34406, partial [Pseudomonas syringae pv. actinidiae ICMP 19079]
MRQKIASLAEHPVKTTVGLALKHLLTGSQVQVGQQLANLHAMLGIGLADVLARQPRLQQRRL